MPTRAGATQVRLLLARFDSLEGHVGAEHVGHDEAAVGLLVVLEQENEGAADRARGAVERVHERGAVDALYARPEPPGRVVGVIRARRELAVTALRLKQRLDV